MHRLFLPFCLLLSPTHGEADPVTAIHSGYLSRTPLGYCASAGYCVPNVFLFWQLPGEIVQTGYLAHGTPGVCCFIKKRACQYCGSMHDFVLHYLLFRLKEETFKEISIPTNYKSSFEFDEYTLNHAAKVGKFQVKWLKEFEEELSNRKVCVQKGSASSNHFTFFKFNANSRSLADDVSIIIFGSQELAKQFGLTPNLASFDLGSFSIDNTLTADKCPTPFRCDRSYPYRSYNASYKNLKKPLWELVDLHSSERLVRLFPPPDLNP